MILLAQSANQKTKDAYATANGAVSDNAKLLSSDISDITSSFQNEANVQRQALSSANKIASITLKVSPICANSFTIFSSAIGSQIADPM